MFRRSKSFNCWIEIDHFIGKGISGFIGVKTAVYRDAPIKERGLG